MEFSSWSEWAWLLVACVALAIGARAWVSAAPTRTAPEHAGRDDLVLLFNGEEAIDLNDHARQALGHLHDLA